MTDGEIAVPASLEIEGLSVRYPGTKEPSLGGIDVRLAGGEQVGVAGRTGAGKSTLALAAAGFIPRVVRARLGGRVAIAGVDAATAGADALLGGWGSSSRRRPTSSRPPS